MIRAYDEIYLDDAKNLLSQFFDYLTGDCDLSADWAARLFVSSGYAERCERGDPAVLAGMSGVELGAAVLRASYQNSTPPLPRFSQNRSPEYWAGWVMAEYQWFSARRFEDIFEHVPFSEIVGMYPVFHEMDVSQFCAAMEAKFAQRTTETKLKNIRESRGLSQSQLAKRSGVSLRSIQTYEQRANDIDKAQAQFVYRLSRALGCRMEDLLEDPRGVNCEAVI